MTTTPRTDAPASLEAVQYADYILNHYSRYSHADKLCLARDLERHGWQRSQYSFARQLETDIAELNERLIDRQKTLMETLIENQNLRRELDKAMHYNQ
jgi:hypothetical protein